MSRMVKAILIDPFTCTVTEVNHDASEIDGIYKLISHETMKVDTFTCIYPNALAKGDAIFVDDDGLYKNCSHRFAILGYPELLVGKGLVLGSDARGRSVSAATPLEWLKSGTEFFALQ